MDQTTFSIHSLNYALVMPKDVIAKASLKTSLLEGHLAIAPVHTVAYGTKN
jgi:hypothetical protein